MPSYSQEKEDLKNQLQTFFSDPKGQHYIEDYISGKTKDIIINLDELALWNPNVANNLIKNASRWGMTALEWAIDAMVVNSSVGNSTIDKAHISITGGDQIVPLVPIHKIGANEIGSIIRVHALVNKTTRIRPMYLSAVFRCGICQDESSSILQENPWNLTKPMQKCKACGGITTWEPVPESSDMADSQEFTIQESYDDISSSKIPRPISCITFRQHLLNFMNCGDDIDALSIVNTMLSSKRKTKFPTTYLEVLSIEKKRKDFESIVFTLEEETQILELPKDPNLYKKMIDSLAPSLYGRENEKEAILLAIFGSPEEKREDLTIRGNIHILMVGDPATAKSQLLRAAVELSPRGMYAVGRGSTAAGLTAAMSKNLDTNEWEISAGVLVLADGGIAAIDEFEKMRDEDRANIHVPMEQQIVSIDKAGYHVKLNARTAIIAAANPSLGSGRYNPEKSIRENLGTKFPESLFSRFDLIFKVLDVPNADIDMKVVSHIIDYKQIKSPIDRNLLRKYVTYSKRINPTLSDEAANILKTYFVKVRNNPVNKNVLSSTYRQFEALKRMTLAHARSLLKTTADKSDVDAVIRLFDVFVKDTLGGDAMCQEDGRNAPERMRIMILTALENKPLSKDDLRDSINCDEKDFEKAFTQLWNEGKIRTEGFNLFGKETYVSTGHHPS
jgi:replicative DNA helicase Mcm